MKKGHLFGTLLAALAISHAVAEEGGSGHYLPGSMSSFVDGVPTEETLILRYNLLYYEGEIGDLHPLPFAGLIAAGAEADSWANGLTVLWRPPLDLGEKWSYAMSTTIPLVSMDVSADVGPAHLNDSIDMIAEVKWLHEMETRRRLEGDYIWFKLVLKF